MSAAGAADKTQPKLDTATVAAAAAAAREQPRRRRRAKAPQLGCGYEYMDPDPGIDAESDTDAVMASDHGAGPVGFSGTASKLGTTRAAGLTTLAADTRGAGPTIPMAPDTWDSDPADEADGERHN
jgi:PPE-repeat protein